MTTYTLRPISASAWQITSERKKVGYVTKCPMGYVARLGQFCETAASAQLAFDAVAVKALGFPNRAALAQHNSAVRSRTRARNAEFRNAVNAAFNADSFQPLLDIISRIK